NVHRQGGKSTTIGVKACHRAVFTPNSLVVIVSKSQRQAGESFRKFLDAYYAIHAPVAFTHASMWASGLASAAERNQLVSPAFSQGVPPNPRSVAPGRHARGNQHARPRGLGEVLGVDNHHFTLALGLIVDVGDQPAVIFGLGPRPRHKDTFAAK